MLPFHTLLFIFAFCAALGWVYEMIAYACMRRRLTFRGLLVGPFLPIYGFGGVVIILLGHNTEASPIVLFLVGMAVATVFEYLASVFLELTFKMSWWDYDHFKLNYKGKVALLPSL
ncbi:putative ABC transporter permease [Candidatus Saccharibacteria bacterium]|nr:putative ABC transporter permease [Candidatus Saccharibacteria bacterium]